METIHFRVNKKRMFRIFIIGLFMLILSLIFVIIPKTFTSNLIESPTIIRVFGIFGVIFFGLAALYAGRKYADTSMGLRITDEGLIDHTSVFRFGLVEWADIQSFETKKMGNVSVILVYLNSPELYIERIPSPVFQKAAVKNHQVYGTPLFINSHILVDGQTSVLNILNQEFDKRKSS